MNYTIITTVTGEKIKRLHKKKGRKPRGYVKVLVNLPAAHVEAMKWQNEKCGGNLSVNEQIRTAVRGMLCGLVYTQLVKS